MTKNHETNKASMKTVHDCSTCINMTTYGITNYCAILPWIGMIESTDPFICKSYVNKEEFKKKIKDKVANK